MSEDKRECVCGCGCVYLCTCAVVCVSETLTWEGTGLGSCWSLAIPYQLVGPAPPPVSPTPFLLCPEVGCGERECIKTEQKMVSHKSG